MERKRASDAHDLGGAGDTMKIRISKRNVEVDSSLRRHGVEMRPPASTANKSIQSSFPSRAKYVTKPTSETTPSARLVTPMAALGFTPERI